MGVRNTTGSRSNPLVSEWGSKARKEQAKAKRKTARDRAVTEGLSDTTDLSPRVRHPGSPPTSSTNPPSRKGGPPTPGLLAGAPCGAMAQVPRRTEHPRWELPRG